MRVITVPAGLRLALALTVLVVPLAATEVVITMNAPWWGLPYRMIATWSAIAAAVFLPLALLTAFGRAWAFHLLTSVALVWVTLSAWMALRLSHFWLGVFTLVLAVFWLALWQWIRFETRRSYFDPLMAWYQGLPRPIPGLTCEAVLGAAGDPGVSPKMFKVSRFDRDGVFIFHRHADYVPDGSRSARVPARVPIRLTFNGKSIRCEGEPVRLFSSATGGAGLGLRFHALAADARKELGDFVEALRGKGYVD